MDYENKSDIYYNKIRQEMLKYMPEKPKRVMDVGCGRGTFAAVVKEKTNAEVWGLEFMEAEAKEAEKVIDKVFAGPCENNIDKLPDNYFDVVYFNDVLEHLTDPYWVVEKFKEKLAPNGIVISSIPNLRYHNALWSLMFKKDFRYRRSGVMDHTHLRFFTKKSIRRMYEEKGYEIIVHEGINRSKSLKPILYNIPLLFMHTDIFYPQFATVAKVRK
ncbi:MAG TPA: class I SAM-dependent methyltransferase [Flavobacteriaceae bacterium]|nr:class I SAM-dependent methyltransferase [Flavobacteriaceae bacterium]